MALAIEAIRLIAIRQPELHSGDVWPVMDPPPSRNGKAIGPAFTSAASLGYVTKSDPPRYGKWTKQSWMTGNSGRPPRIWISNLY